MSDERTYESAVGRVEEIIRRLDSGEAGLRETLELVARAASWSSTAPASSTRSARAWRSSPWRSW